jgi:hypothetical protein
LHPKAIDKIERHIRGSLKNCTVKDNWPEYESFSVHVDSLSEEILKHKKAWLYRADVFSIFYDFVYTAFKAAVEVDQKVEGNLWDILGDERSQQLTASLKDYFISIPRTFDIYLPIPEVTKNIPSTIKLSNEISVVSFQDADKVPGGYFRGLMSLDNKLEVGKVYIKQRMSGHAGNRLENTCVKGSVNNLKIILQQGMFRGLFKLTPEGKAGLGLFGAFTHHQIKKSKVVSVDEAFDKPRVTTVELPIDVCRLLNNIDINWDSEPMTKALERNELDKAITALLIKPVQLIDCQDEEATRVKAAIKWCFDSYAVENQTLAFLQVCIGLEALLGDTDYSGALTETLADRCSYLVGDNIRGRRTIKNNFKELYEVRSKLVHGNITELDSEQAGYLQWGKSVLEYAILKEMKHLNLGRT